MNDAIGEVLSRLGPVKKSPNGWEAKCPAKEHGEDKNPSLSVSIGDQGRVLLCCHKNCTYEAIREGLAMSAPDLAGERHEGEWTPAGPASAIYDYTDEAGNLLFQVLRTIPKAFRQRCPDPLAKSGWAWRLGDVRRVLYRLPRVVAAVDEGRTIFVVEGEEDVHAAERAGEVATCNPGGAGKWRDDYSPFFVGAEVVVVADRDEAGQGHARQVSTALRPVAQSVIVAEPKSGKDLRDHLRAGLTVDELEVTQRPDQADTPVDLVPDVHDFLAEVDTWDWCVPGLLERRERLMVTGGEGGGKTTVLRMLAVTIAAGLHPFTMARTEPRRVLLVDCENPRSQTRRKLRPMVHQATVMGAPLAHGQLRVKVREAMDLANQSDVAWLVERVTAHEPDVLVIGPLYQLHAGNPNDEQSAREVGKALEAAQSVSGCAIIVEHHAGHGESGKNRDLRPYGNSYWRRWVSYGYGLHPVPDTDGRQVWFRAWRGPRDERAWPDRLDRGQVWPWEGVYLDGCPAIEGVSA